MVSYMIKPLTWKRSISKEEDCVFICYSARTRFGSFDVTLEASLLDKSRRVYWEHCFDQYYDEASTDCKSIKAGLKAAEAYWISTLKEHLEEVAQ